MRPYPRPGSAILSTDMLVPRNVEVHGATDQVAELAKRLRAAGGRNEWQPAHAQGEKVRRRPTGEEPLVFEFKAADGQRALLWFFPKGDRASVGNIVPLDRQKLEPARYNSIVASFVATYLEPICKDIGCRIELGPEERTAKSSLSEAAMRALEHFSDHANKGTGNAHPDDARRWADFVIQCFRDRTKMGVYVFREWMREAEWEDSVIDDLYDDYETGLEILKRYEETR